MKCHTFFISIAVLMVLSVKLVLASSDSQLVSSRNTSIYTNSSDEQTKVLSRRKRFIAFPEGSTFSVSVISLFYEVIFKNWCFLNILMPSSNLSDSFLCINWLHWKSRVRLHELGFELGLSI